MIIAVGCRSRVGKDTFVDYIASKYESKIIRFAAPLYDAAFAAQMALKQSLVKQPSILQGLGEGIRKAYGADFFVKIAENAIRMSIDSADCQFILIPDLRHKIEFQMLKKYNAITIRIERPHRPIDRDSTHISEIDLDGIDMDIFICNDTDLQTYYDNIDRIVDHLLTGVIDI